MLNQIKIILVLLLSNSILSFNALNDIKRKHQEKKEHVKSNEKKMDNSKLEANHKSKKGISDKARKLINEGIEICENEDENPCTKIKSVWCLDNNCGQVQLGLLLLEPDFKQEIFELLDLNNNGTLSSFEFLALSKHNSAENYKKILNVYRGCDEHNLNNELSLENFKSTKCSLKKEDEDEDDALLKLIHENLINISDGLDGSCDSKLQPAELIKLFEKADILSIAVEKIDMRIICSKPEEPNDLGDEGKGDGKLNLNEFKYFVKIQAVQNLYFAKFDLNKEKSIISYQFNGLISLIDIPGYNEKITVTNPKKLKEPSGQLVIDVNNNIHQNEKQFQQLQSEKIKGKVVQQLSIYEFRDALNKGKQVVNAIFKETKKEDDKLTQDEIKNYLTT